MVHTAELLGYYQILTTRKADRRQTRPNVMMVGRGIFVPEQTGGAHQNKQVFDLWCGSLLGCVE